MLIVKIQGGLGNQMFQYAFGRSLSLKRTEPLMLDVSDFPGANNRHYALDNFSIKAKIASSEDCYRLKYRLQPLYWRVLCRMFDKPCPPAGPSNWCLQQKISEYLNTDILDIKFNYFDGYWQNEKYFVDIREELLETFKIADTPSEPCSSYMDMIKRKNAVSIHIRRGDYAENPKVKKIHGVLSRDYYTEAIRLIKQQKPEPVFFFFSDDIEWCKLNLPESGVFVENTSDLEDLYLMSLCKNNIIANSSFSWWGAWLNEDPEKIVVAPRQWFADTGLNEIASEICPSSWIRL